MAQPFNYAIPRPDLGQKFVSGFQAGEAIGSALTADTIKKQYETDLKDAFANPTADRFAQLAVKYPQQREAFKQGWETLSQEQRDTEFLTGAQAFNALNAGKIDVAKSILDQQITATKNSGRPTIKLEAMRTTLDQSPELVQGQLGLVLSSIEPDKWAKVAGESRTFETTQQERVSPKLSESGLKIVNESATNAINAEQLASRNLNLASELEKMGGGYGAATSFAEWFKQSTGNQGAMTALRQEYTRLRNSQAIKSLPPGPATDKDIQLALKGFPPENADSKVISSFLRGVAKLNQIEAVTEGAKSEWVNSVGSLGRSKRDIDIGGTMVPAGTTFVEFARQFVDKKAENLGKEQGQANVGSRSYMKYAKPQGK